MKPLRVKEMTSNTGDRVTLAAPGVTCIVGGNNVGKSLILREIAALLEWPDRSRFVALEGLDSSLPALEEGEDAEVWLSVAGTQAPTQPQNVPQYSPILGGQAMTANDLRAALGGARSSLGGLRAWFCWHATAGSLLGQASGSIGHPGMGGQSLLGRLFRDGDLEANLSAVSEEAFGTHLTLDRVSGDTRLRVGKCAVPAPPFDHPTREYADAVAALPPLESQGDGIKSFLGLALVVVASGIPVLLVDEPEAFLHPAQARALGRWLASQAVSHDLQIVLATHDRDIVLGLLDAQDAEVTVVRVRRDGTRTHLQQLHPTELRSIWSDPVLRYSNVLQGLFFRRVCVCEADADCRWYSAVMDDIAVERGMRASADDVLFVPSGGKDRVAKLSAAVSSLGIDTFAIVDFDVLNKRAKVVEILKALGGSWTDEINANYVVTADALNGAALWPEVKTHGLDAVPAGEATQSARQLLAALADQGLLIVPVGELESFERGFKTEGSQWVTEMFAANGHRTCEPARQLVSPLLPAVQ